MQILFDPYKKDLDCSCIHLNISGSYKLYINLKHNKLSYEITKLSIVYPGIKDFVFIHNDNRLRGTLAAQAYVGHILMYPIKKKITMLFFLNAIKFLGFYIKNSNFELKIYYSNYKSHYKTTVFDNYKAGIYRNKIAEQMIGHHARFLSVQHLN